MYKKLNKKLLKLDSSAQLHSSDDTYTVTKKVKTHELALVFILIFSNIYFAIKQFIKSFIELFVYIFLF